MYDRVNIIYGAINVSGDTFIDLTNNKAYLDSEEFICLLEIAAGLQERQYDHTITPSSEEQWVNDVRSGKTLLFPIHLHQIGNFRYYMALFEDAALVGMPTSTGGQHSMLMMWEGFGINAASQHKEAAWSFVRRFFLPETEVPSYGIPIRIDAYEKEIDRLKTANIVNGEEVPEIVTYYGHRLEIFAMTDDEAAIFREVIENIAFAWRDDCVIMDIISEDTTAFFNGTKTAADTARIIQSRIQIYLDERS